MNELNKTFQGEDHSLFSKDRIIDNNHPEVYLPTICPYWIFTLHKDKCKYQDKKLLYN